MMSEDLSLKVLTKVLECLNLFCFLSQRLVQELALDIDLDVKFLEGSFFNLLDIFIFVVFLDEDSQFLLFILDLFVQKSDLVLEVLNLLLLSLH